MILQLPHPVGLAVLRNIQAGRCYYDNGAHTPRMPGAGRAVTELLIVGLIVRRRDHDYRLTSAGRAALLYELAGDLAAVYRVDGMHAQSAGDTETAEYL